ncbi:MAG TPA: polyphosphate kinase 2 family protein, partial [Bryobacteraceae bacterium]|nr:polyphosphate kinase 2 family protein [Bryobacteraceae bacterium]
MDLAKHCIVKPDSKVRLKDRDPDDTFGKRRNDKALEKTLEKLRRLQNLLYADRRYALLIVLQALDAGGKDGTISHVMSGVNPQGCQVTSFKQPNQEELAHDFLWRVHKATPALGNIGIFNRSHYEDVLVVRVH